MNQSRFNQAIGYHIDLHKDNYHTLNISILSNLVIGSMIQRHWKLNDDLIGTIYERCANYLTRK